jgi:DNA-binding transcriptional MerR regulator
MSRESTIPTYNLKAVIQETGIKPDTLRAWERRYGMPVPERSPGGHRLFTHRDIETVKWLLARQEEGLSISRAVDLWKQIEAEGNDPLLEMEYGIRPPSVLPHLQVGDAIEDYRAEWIEACKRFDEQAAQQILNQAFAIYPAEVVALELLTKALSEIGAGWYRSEITVQQEHFASALATRRIETLISASPPPTLPGRVLILCPPGEEHTFSPLLLTFLIKRRGYDALFLGANVPLQRLDKALESTKPRLTIMTAQQLHSAASLRRMAESVSLNNVPVAFGGRIFNLIPELRGRIPGTFLGERLDEVPTIVDRLLRNPPPPSSPSPIPGALKEAHERFLEHQPEIDIAVWQRMTPETAPYNHIAIANQNLAQNIDSALQLGDIAYLAQDVAWVKGLLGNHGLPKETIDRFMIAYAEALQDTMDDEGKLITEYLTQIVEYEGGQT